MGKKEKEFLKEHWMIIMFVIAMILAIIAWEFAPTTHEECIVATFGEPYFNETLDKYVRILTLNNTCDYSLRVILELKD